MCLMYYITYIKYDIKNFLRYIKVWKAYLVFSAISTLTVYFNLRKGLGIFGISFGINMILVMMENYIKVN